MGVYSTKLFSLLDFALFLHWEHNHQVKSLDGIWSMQKLYHVHPTLPATTTGWNCWLSHDSLFSHFFRNNLCTTWSKSVYSKISMLSRRLLRQVLDLQNLGCNRKFPDSLKSFHHDFSFLRNRNPLLDLIMSSIRNNFDDNWSVWDKWAGNFVSLPWKHPKFCLWGCR